MGPGTVSDLPSRPPLLQEDQDKIRTIRHTQRISVQQEKEETEFQLIG
jgi:hypothetical protein